MLKWMVVIVGILVAAKAGVAQEKEKLVGLWKLVSFQTEIQATGERRDVYGKNPSGYWVYTPEGRMIGMIVGAGRKAGETDQDRAALHRTMIAYSGIYTVEGDKSTTKVDMSWNQAWVGTEQVRFFTISGDRVEFISAWAPSPNIPERPMVRGVLTWERVK
jgi:Lipocalin-like domain